MREKDEWRFATMEYGGQCVTTAGTRWMLVWSVQSWDTPEVGEMLCTFSNIDLIYLYIQLPC